jgi:hypothetical protein
MVDRCKKRPTARPRRFRRYERAFPHLPARKHRDAPGGFHVDRLKCALFVFDVETDGIHDCPGTADSTRH